MPKKKKTNSNKKADGKNTFKGEITRVVRGHGFLKESGKAGTEYFLSGRDLLGAIPGDTVLFKKKKGVSIEGGLTEAEVVRVLEHSANILTGTVVENGERGLSISPDSFGTRFPLEIKIGSSKFKLGDKVKFSIKARGDRHSDHIANVVSVYGDSEKAKICVTAYLEEKNIPVKFPDGVKEEVEGIGQSVKPRDTESRLDLRGLPIFTIDGADTKDIDDAVYVEKTDGGYKLGVHIADVSHYVKQGSELDKEAFKRGTSVYIADMVVPMLPKELSNGICSLNPNEDRLAFSCLMDVRKSGEIASFEFKKSVIRSRVQGVYGEVNAILGNPDSPVPDKYKEVAAQFPIMAELARVLAKNREGRGAPALEAAESKIICGENGECLDVKRRISGASEGIIEEFMLMANNAAARLAMEKDIPFVYRVHEPPAEEKLTRLSETLAALGVNAPVLKATAKSLSDVITAAKNTDRADVINMMVLRSMMKAKYSNEPLGHFGLVMKEYAHFTSPIRRYPDLSIHRILSEYVSNGVKNMKKYEKFAYESGVKTSLNELRAVSAERDCNCFYFAEYMSRHIGEEYDGVISGVTPNSVFIMLPNTVEGRASLPYGEFKLDGDAVVVHGTTGAKYTLGDKVRVKCAGASVPAGNVDFELLKNG